MTARYSTTWLFSRPIDLLVLGLPVWLAWLACFALPDTLLHQAVPLWVWVVFVLGIDVSHVWSTLFRTYLDKEEFHAHRKTLLVAPLVCFGLCFLLAGWSIDWFWRVLAYVALFHFIKQQYGFLALYRAKSRVRLAKRLFKDKWVIYFAMLYPVVFWHLSPGRAFSWFEYGDFFALHQWWSTIAAWLPLTHGLYWAILAGWVAEEVWQLRKGGHAFLWGKTLWILTTAGNWFIGIVWFNSDLAFTLTNVIAHGVPYLALIFFYVERKKTIKIGQQRKRVSVLANIGWMLLVVGLLALGEEYLWDMWLFREKEGLFTQWVAYPMQAFTHPLGQALAFALLALPQTTHYVIDGFIWKNNDRNPYLRQIFKPS